MINDVLLVRTGAQLEVKLRHDSIGFLLKRRVRAQATKEIVIVTQFYQLSQGRQWNQSRKIIGLNLSGPGLSLSICHSVSGTMKNQAEPNDDFSFLISNLSAALTWRVIFWKAKYIRNQISFPKDRSWWGRLARWEDTPKAMKENDRMLVRTAIFFHNVITTKVLER